MRMFRITCFVDEKHLGEILFQMMGRTRGTPEVQPVVNAEPKANGHISQTAANTLEAFGKALKKGQELTAKDMRELTQKLGFSPTSYNHFAAQLVKAGMMKKAGSPQKRIYTVVK